MSFRTIGISIGCVMILAGCTGSAGRGRLFRPSRPAAAQPAAEPADVFPANPTLADYLRVAAMNNQGLEAAFNRWKAALERVPQARALPEPRFTYRYFIEEVETRVGAQRQSFALAQMFPWFGKLALRGDVADLAAQAEYQRYQAAKLKLFYEVRHAYYEYYYLARAIAVAAENMKLLKFLEGVARARYRAAGGSHPDVIRAQVELGKLDDRLRALRDLRGPIVAGLNAALNRPHDAPLPEPKAIEDRSPSFKDEQLFDWLAESNPQLKALDADIERSRRGVSLARKDYFPDITLGINYIDTANSTSGRNPPDDGKDPIVAMVSVNLPIWWDKLDAAVRQARRRHLAAVHTKQQKANSLSAELKLALYRFHDAERKIDLYRDTLLPKAKQSFQVTQAAYRAAKAGFSDLIDAQRILLAFELAFERALADRAGRLARLEMLVGRDIAPAGNP